MCFLCVLWQSDLTRSTALKSVVPLRLLWWHIKHYRALTRPYPAHTISSPSTFESSTFRVANPNSPSLSNVNVWSPYDENVVKPPNKPTRITVRSVGFSRNLSSVRLKITPAIRQPAIFTTIVPHGKVSPYRRATNPAIQYLKRVPAMPATPIKIVLVMSSLPSAISGLCT